jgi:hypothetical protein
MFRARCFGLRDRRANEDSGHEECDGVRFQGEFLLTPIVMARSPRHNILFGSFGSQSAAPLHTPVCVPELRTCLFSHASHTRWRPTSEQVQDSGSANPDNDFRFGSMLGSTGGYIFNLRTVGLTTGLRPLRPLEYMRPLEHIRPWTIRDRMLNEMRWCSKGIPWAEWGL